MLVGWTDVYSSKKYVDSAWTFPLLHQTHARWQCGKLHACDWLIWQASDFSTIAGRRPQPVLGQNQFWKPLHQSKSGWWWNTQVRNSKSTVTRQKATMCHWRLYIGHTHDNLGDNKPWAVDYLKIFIAHYIHLTSDQNIHWNVPSMAKARWIASLLWRIEIDTQSAHHVVWHSLYWSSALHRSDVNCWGSWCKEVLCKLLISYK